MKELFDYHQLSKFSIFIAGGMIPYSLGVIGM